MVDFKYDFAFLIKMIKFVFLPVLAIVIITAFIIYIYSRKVKKQDIQKYNYLVEFWTTFLAILIIGALFAVTVGFSISLSNSIRMYNLVEGNEVIYYLVLCSPLVPMLFLAIYIYRMIIVLLSKPKKQKKLVSEEEIVPEPTSVNEEEINNDVTGDKIGSINEDELYSPIVVEESDEVEEIKEEIFEQEIIEVREFTPVVAPERYDDSEGVEEPVEEKSEDISQSIEENEEIELL